MNNPQIVNLVMIVGFIAIFYFILLRPQSVQQKKRKELLESLKVGDKVLLNSGIYGEITEVRKSSLRVKIAKDVIVRMDRSGVQSKTSKEKEEAD
ncbi:MAG: preprotein translocase subunit YajC [bacterium ADurb.Bin236]|nr:MAG: preprotein translocase subunit YajC [bacterium ADurb.Bin236]HOY62710.1 preprotein translocase subunit YajC [bacterium]HPN93320.1 preprotein translocase subunit YajC [bacterium]